MTSFRTDISARIDHGKAEFQLLDAWTAGRSHLSKDASWLLQYAYCDVGEGGFPCRSDLIPGEMKALLPNVMILGLERSEDGALEDIIVRLAGSDMAAFYGQISGQSLRMLKDATAADRGFEAVGTVLATGRPVVGISVRRTAEVPYLPVSILFVPITEDRLAIGQILVHFSAHPTER